MNDGHEESLKNFYATEAKWDASFKKLFSDTFRSFISEVTARCQKRIDAVRLSCLADSMLCVA